MEQHYNSGKAGLANILLGIGISLAVLGGAGYYQHWRAAPALEEAAQGELAAVRFLDANGKERRLSEFAGKPMVLNFWATWCAPCVKELPALAALGERYSGQIEVIALAQENIAPERAANFFTRKNIKGLAVYVDPETTAFKSLALSGLPTTLLIDPSGAVVERIEGEILWQTEEELQKIESLLKR